MKINTKTDILKYVGEKAEIALRKEGLLENGEIFLKKGPSLMLICNENVLEIPKCIRKEVKQITKEGAPHVDKTQVRDVKNAYVKGCRKVMKEFDFGVKQDEDVLQAAFDKACKKQLKKIKEKKAVIEQTEEMEL